MFAGGGGFLVGCQCHLLHVPLLVGGSSAMTARYVLKGPQYHVLRDSNICPENRLLLLLLSQRLLRP